MNMHVQNSGPWLEESGPNSDVVVSSRARLARNLNGYPFVNQSSIQQQSEIMQMFRSLQLHGHQGENLEWIDMDHASPHDRQILFERHLVSRQFIDASTPRAVAVGDDASLSLMINEEDHLRMQVLLPGLQLADAYSKVLHVDQELESRIDIAVHPRWGYLTACPTNVGTACRFSVMLHLPGLRSTNEMERVKRAAKDLHLAVRGFYGEGSESAGDFYQVSNQITLGMQETDLLDEFLNVVVPRIIEYERIARNILLKNHQPMLDDRVHRALATMRSARLLGIDEAMKLLSRVRLGVAMNRLDSVDMGSVQKLFLQLQPAHLVSEYPQLAEAQTDPTKMSFDDNPEMRKIRADVARKTLNP